MKKLILIITVIIVMMSCEKDNNLKWAKDLNHPNWLCNETWTNIDSSDLIISIYFNDIFNSISINKKNKSETIILYGWSYDEDSKLIINNSDEIAFPIVFECAKIDSLLYIIWDNRIIKFK